MGIYKGLIQNYGVYSPKNELCAGAIFIKSKHKTIFLFSGLTVEGRELNAMAMLISAFIEDHSQHPITLDFEGSNDPQLARFYKSFGAITSTYPHLEINNLPFLTKLAVRLVKTFR